MKIFNEAKQPFEDNSYDSIFLTKEGIINFIKLF